MQVGKDEDQGGGAHTLLALETVALLLEKIKMMSICVFSVPVGVGAMSGLSCQFPGHHTGEAVLVLLCTIPATHSLLPPPPHNTCFLPLMEAHSCPQLRLCFGIVLNVKM